MNPKTRLWPCERVIIIETWEASIHTYRGEDLATGILYFAGQKCVQLSSRRWMIDKSPEGSDMVTIDLRRSLESAWLLKVARIRIKRSVIAET